MQVNSRQRGDWNPQPPPSCTHRMYRGGVAQPLAVHLLHIAGAGAGQKRLGGGGGGGGRRGGGTLPAATPQPRAPPRRRDQPVQQGPVHDCRVHRVVTTGRLRPAGGISRSSRVRYMAAGYTGWSQQAGSAPPEGPAGPAGSGAWLPGTQGGHNRPAPPRRRDQQAQQGPVHGCRVHRVVTTGRLRPAGGTSRPSRVRYMAAGYTGWSQQAGSAPPEGSAGPAGSGTWLPGTQGGHNRPAPPRRRDQQAQQGPVHGCRVHRVVTTGRLRPTGGTSRPSRVRYMAAGYTGWSQQAGSAPPEGPAGPAGSGTWLPGTQGGHNRPAPPRRRDQPAQQGFGAWLPGTQGGHNRPAPPRRRDQPVQQGPVHGCRVHRVVTTGRLRPTGGTSRPSRVRCMAAGYTGWSQQAGSAPPEGSAGPAGSGTWLPGTQGGHNRPAPPRRRDQPAQQGSVHGCRVHRVVTTGRLRPAEGISRPSRVRYMTAGYTGWSQQAGPPPRRRTGLEKRVFR